MQHLAEFFEQGGFFMYVNLLCSVITIAFIVERTIFFLGKGSVNAKAFLEQIRKLVAANNVDRAIKLCSATEATVARVAKAGLARLPKGEAAVTTAIEETLVDVTPELKKRIGSLWSLANIATLIGLIGTVSGLIRTFASIAAQGLSQADKQRMLSNGIAEAMYNTAFGLSIAVVCMIAHVFLHTRGKNIQHDLESTTERVFNLLTVSGKSGY